MDNSADLIAREVLDVIPMIMRTIRTEMRSRRSTGMSVVQFRTLVFLERHPGASLSAVADHLGLTLPTVSQMIDGMVGNQIVTREDCSDDRRRVMLTLTTQGQSLLEKAHYGTQARLADIFAGLTPEQRQAVHQAMQLLQELFSPVEISQPS